jgi:acyl-CoA thioester hydrolase
MTRVKIELPDSLPFATEIPLRITDINYGNHTGNQVFPELMHEARVRFLSGIELSELNFAGSSLIMADMAIEFRSEILYGDLVQIEVGISSINRYGFDITYLIKCQRNGESFLAARCKTAMICFEYNKKKVEQIPQEAIERLERFKY